MMRWEMLNAYVDGELDAGARQAVADAARRDPDVAARIATLSRLKGAVRVAELAEPRAGRPAGGIHPAGWACAALALILGGALLVREARVPEARIPPADPALAAFAVWTGAGPPADRARDAAAARADEAAVPDLRAAGFTLVHLAPAGDAGGHLAGYAGPHGCRIALWTGPAAVATGPDGAAGPLRVARWGADGRRFVALSDGLEAERFGRVVALLQELVRRPDPARIRLATARAAATTDRPCAG
ncbi:anti-sigma factor family protein [Methylobacterium nigriterrae]|uniref:anti-sigma factor family protein n=1 Tax=Methylobacterium nigriterrae TaxID=3127512 RepID=UPI0030137236